MLASASVWTSLYLFQVDIATVWCWHHMMDMAEKEATKGSFPALFYYKVSTTYTLIFYLYDNYIEYLQLSYSYTSGALQEANDSSIDHKEHLSLLCLSRFQKMFVDDFSLKPSSEVY